MIKDRPHPQGEERDEYTTVGHREYASQASHDDEVDLSGVAGSELKVHGIV